MYVSIELQRKVVLGMTIAVSSALAYAFCPPQYQETFVQPVFQTSTQALNQAVQAVDKALSLELKQYSERLTSAVAILTKQKALTAHQVASTNLSSAQMTAEAMNVLSQTDRVKQARFEYGGEFGQGYQPCVVYAGRNLLANREADMPEERRVRMVSEVPAAPGKYMDPLQARTDQAKEHRENFCTQDQVDAGMCTKVGAMAGKSLNVATLFQPVMDNEDLYKAKVAFVNNVTPPPDAPVPSSAAKSPAAAAYALAKAQKDALMSPALTSLKEIQLEYSGVDTAHSGADIPMAMRIDNEVKRYLGNTPDYQAWVKAMVGQNSRGLMVEMLKVKALDLMLLERQYRQYERMEANVATLVAGEMRKQSERTEAAALQATRQDATRQIK